MCSVPLPPASRSLNVCYFHGAFETDAAVQLVLEHLTGGQLWERCAGSRGWSCAGSRDWPALAHVAGLVIVHLLCLGGMVQFERAAVASVLPPGRDASMAACMAQSPCLARTVTLEHVFVCPQGTARRLQRAGGGTDCAGCGAHGRPGAFATAVVVREYGRRDTPDQLAWSNVLACWCWRRAAPAAAGAARVVAA